MGLFGIDSTSNATDNRMTVSDNGIAVRGKGTVAEQGALVVSNGGRYNSGILVGRNNSGTITVNDTAALEDLAAQSTGTLGDALAGSGSLLSNALGKISDLSESSQTGGASEQNKIILYIVLGVLAVFGLIFYVRK